MAEHLTKRLVDLCRLGLAAERVPNLALIMQNVDSAIHRPTFTS
jgi:hypothetical protein